MVRGVLNCSEERSAFHKLDKCIKIGEEPSEYTTFGNLEWFFANFDASNTPSYKSQLIV